MAPTACGKLLGKGFACPSFHADRVNRQGAQKRRSVRRLLGGAQPQGAGLLAGSSTPAEPGTTASQPPGWAVPLE